MGFSSFIETDYISNSVDGIKKLYKTCKPLCKICKKNHVDTKMAVLDPHEPTFVILKKNYCFSCWLELVSLVG